jgi:hypothetical protein
MNHNIIILQYYYFQSVITIELFLLFSGLELQYIRNFALMNLECWWQTSSIRTVAMLEYKIMRPKLLKGYDFIRLLAICLFALAPSSTLTIFPRL